MSRRRKDDLWREFYESLSWLFTAIHPAWCIPVAIFFFCIPLFFLRREPQFSPVQLLFMFLGAIPAILSLAAGFAGWQARKQRGVFLQEKLDIDWMKSLSWQVFERQVAEIYRQQGYHVEETGGGGADGGVDLRLSRDGAAAIVQCKQWKTYKVGVKPVRELFGVMAAEQADRAIFITSGIYTDEALSFAEGKSIELIDGAQLTEMLRQFQSSVKAVLHPDATAPSTPSEPLAAQTAPPRPKCPRCGSEMALRRAKRGQHAGREFWGCSMWGKTGCGGIRAVE